MDTDLDVMLQDVDDGEGEDAGENDLRYNANLDKNLPHSKTMVQACCVDSSARNRENNSERRESAMEQARRTMLQQKAASPSSNALA